MKKAFKQGLVLAFFATATLAAEAKEPIELLCHVQYLKCSEIAGVPNECWGFDKPRWLFDLKTFLGKYRQDQTFLIDEAKGVVQINGFSYSTQPESGGTTKPYAELKILPDNITLKIESYQDCEYGGDCKFRTHERIDLLPKFSPVVSRVLHGYSSA